MTTQEAAVENEAWRHDIEMATGDTPRPHHHRGYAAWALKYAARCRRLGFLEAARHAVKIARTNREMDTKPRQLTVEQARALNRADPRLMAIKF